jgi:multisubunit Na+/H+ antiporter MnhC subunit
MYMIIVVSVFLLIFGSLSAYAYSDIEEETSDGLYAKNIFLSNLIVSFLFAFLLIIGKYFKLISENRLLLISLAILVVSSVLFILTAYFLEEERTSPSGYNSAHTDLINNTIRKNVNLITLSIVLASIGIAVFALFVSYLTGRYWREDKGDMEGKEKEEKEEERGKEGGNKNKSIIIKSEEKPKTVVIKRVNDNINNDLDLYDDYQIRRIMIV